MRTVGPGKRARRVRKLEAGRFYDPRFICNRLLRSKFLDAAFFILGEFSGRVPVVFLEIAGKAQ